jgi:hypothetical protein
MSANLQCESDYFGGVLSYQLDQAHPKRLQRLTVEPYIEWLHRLRNGGGELPAPRTGASYGIYRRVMDEWENGEALASVTFELCDFHCEAMRYNVEGPGEFIDTPFNLVPVEILALYQVRQELGLVIPGVRHTILQGRTAQMEGNAREAEDEVLRQIKGLLPHYERRLKRRMAVWATAEQDVLGEDPIPPVNPLGRGAPQWMVKLAKKFGIK